MERQYTCLLVMKKSSDVMKNKIVQLAINNPIRRACSLHPSLISFLIFGISSSGGMVWGGEGEEGEEEEEEEE